MNASSETRNPFNGPKTSRNAYKLPTHVQIHTQTNHNNTKYILRSTFDGDEVGPTLVGNGFGQQSFAAARGTIEQHACLDRSEKREATTG